MFNANLFNAARFNPSSVQAQAFRDSISVVKVTDGAGAAAVLAQNAIATVGGRILVGPVAKLTSNVTNVATSIIVDAAVFANGDVIVLQTAPTGIQQTEYMAITSASSGTGPYTYNVTRNLDGSGADAWTIGDTVTGLGQTGQSFIDLYSARGLKSATEVGPSMVGNVRNSATYNDWTPRWVVGNLRGLYGYGAVGIYGAAFGVPSGAWLKIDPTNGVRIGFNATTKVAIDASGNASFAGDISAATGTIGGWTLGANLTGLGVLDLRSGGSIVGSNFTINSAGVTVSSGNLTVLGTINADFLHAGNTLLVTNSGTFGTTVSAAGGYRCGGVQVVGSQGAAVADATNATDVITQLNALLARLRTHGLIA